MAKKEDRFIKTVVDSGGFSDNYMAIYVDRQTGVNYLFSSCGNSSLSRNLLYQFDSLNVGPDSGFGAAGQVQTVTDHKVAALGIDGGFPLNLLHNLFMKLFCLFLFARDICVLSSWGRFVTDIIVGHIFAYGW